MALNYNTKIPGVYFDFNLMVEQAIEGSEGAVAIVMSNYNQTATAGELYEFSNTAQEDAKNTIGVSNYDPIRRIFEGGAARVIVYTLPAADDTTGEFDYTGAQAALRYQFFEALTFDHELTAAALTDWTDWYNSQTITGRFLPIFYGLTTEETPDEAITRITNNKDEGLITPLNAPRFGDTAWSTLDFSQWLAGVYSANGLGESLTYEEVPEATNVTRHLTNTELESALEAGAIVVEYTGRKVRIVSGLTSAGTTLESLAFKQVFARDVKFFLEENVIGQVPNGTNERLAIAGTLKAEFLDRYAAQGVIDGALPYDIVLEQGQTKKQVIVKAHATRSETMEQIFIHFTEGASA